MTGAHRQLGVLDPRPQGRDREAQPSSGVDSGPADGVSEWAPCGWLVEVRLTIDKGPGFRFFAVGIAGPEQAKEAILRYPGVIRDDVRTVRRQLSAEEIARLQLRAHGVRPYRVISRRSPA